MLESDAAMRKYKQGKHLEGAGETEEKAGRTVLNSKLGESSLNDSCRET